MKAFFRSLIRLFKKNRVEILDVKEEVYVRKIALLADGSSVEVVEKEWRRVPCSLK